MIVCQDWELLLTINVTARIRSLALMGVSPSLGRTPPLPSLLVPPSPPSLPHALDDLLEGGTGLLVLRGTVRKGRETKHYHHRHHQY